MLNEFATVLNRVTLRLNECLEQLLFVSVPFLFFIFSKVLSMDA